MKMPLWKGSQVLLPNCLEITLSIYLGCELNLVKSLVSHGHSSVIKFIPALKVKNEFFLSSLTITYYLFPCMKFRELQCQPYRVLFISIFSVHTTAPLCRAGMITDFLLYFQVTTQVFLEAVTLKHKIKSGQLHVD